MYKIYITSKNLAVYAQYFNRRLFIYCVQTEKEGRSSIIMSQTLYAKEFLEEMEKEGRELEELNARLANYVDRVEKLEEEDRKIVADLKESRRVAMFKVDTEKPEIQTGLPNFIDRINELINHNRKFLADLQEESLESANKQTKPKKKNKKNKKQKKRR
ncbi:unnamed protein product [Caenorhabditis angaria]|uniref:Uncharacterized protein n=1 Tax=Caenorhabditis angaria TaxID=860376 RepID=A0A9P1I8R6_9PELO|nr:unnamed protein product [Caenorhabditis angaria]